MDEQILNYLDITKEQKEKSLRELKNIGFCPAYGKETTIKKIMDKSVAGEMPQFYFVFRSEQLIGYMFIIGDTQKYRAFPWLAVSNADELSMRVTRPLIEIEIKAWTSVGNKKMADFVREQLSEYEKGIGHRPEHLCR